MQRMRLVSVSYLNALPLTWGLSRGSQRGVYDLTMAPPFECARLLRDGLVDVGLIPSIAFARISGLLPVPGTGISSRHEVRSVLLISHETPSSIRSLAVDSNSRTSVALARLILGHRYRCRPRVETMTPDLEAMLGAHDAALLIGDAALRASLAASSDRTRYVLDLAREWNEMTGMPFVFAMWACRPVVDAREMKDALDRSLEEGLMNIDRIAAEESRRTSLPAEAIASYLRHCIQFRLGGPESDSLRVFYRMCREEGLLADATAGAGVMSQTAGFFARSARPRGTAGGTGTAPAPAPRLPRGR